MELCSDGHDEIVYEGGRHAPCPLCAANEKVKELESDVERLVMEIKDHVCAE